MFVRPHTHAQHDLIKWMVLLAIASALTLAWGTSIGGAADLRPPLRAPAPLPEQIDSWASALPGDKNQPTRSDQLCRQIWLAIELTRHERYEEAAETWNELELPRETTVWRHVALAQLHLLTGEVGAAAESLQIASRLRPDNGVVHFFLGVLRLEQARLAEDWNDALGRSDTVLVSRPPADISPNSRSMYKLAAMMQLELAVKHGPDAWLEEPLVPDECTDLTTATPTVRDALQATGADPFVAKAHNMLGALYLERHSLEQAEHNMDRAVAGGQNVLYGYSELAQQYERDERPADAARAWLKAAAQEPGKMGPLRGAWKNFKSLVF